MIKVVTLMTLAAKLLNYCKNWIAEIPVGYKIGWGVFSAIALISPHTGLAFVFYLLMTYLIAHHALRVWSSIVSFVRFVFFPVNNIIVDNVGEDIKSRNTKES